MSQSYDQYLDDQLYQQEVADEEFTKFYEDWLNNPDAYNLDIRVSRPNFDDDYMIDIKDNETKQAILKLVDKKYGNQLSSFYNDEIYLSDLEDAADLDMVRQAEGGEDIA